MFKISAILIAIALFGCNLTQQTSTGTNDRLRRYSSSSQTTTASQPGKKTNLEAFGAGGGGGLGALGALGGMTGELGVGGAGGAQIVEVSLDQIHLERLKVKYCTYGGIGGIYGKGTGVGGTTALGEAGVEALGGLRKKDRLYVVGRGFVDEDDSSDTIDCEQVEDSLNDVQSTAQQKINDKILQLQDEITNLETLKKTLRQQAQTEDDLHQKEFEVASAVSTIDEKYKCPCNTPKKSMANNLTHETLQIIGPRGVPKSLEVEPQPGKTIASWPVFRLISTGRNVLIKSDGSETAEAHNKLQKIIQSVNPSDMQFIPTYYGSIEDKPNEYVIDYIVGDTLKSFYEDEELSSDKRLLGKIWLKMIEFLRFMAKYNIHHSDLHADQIVIEVKTDGTGINVKLVDFKQMEIMSDGESAALKVKTGQDLSIPMTHAYTKISGGALLPRGKPDANLPIRCYIEIPDADDFDKVSRWNDPNLDKFERCVRSYL